MKICKKCNCSKELSEFFKHPSTKDKHTPMCKVCYKEYQTDRRKNDVAFMENKKRAMKVWYHKNETNKQRALENRKRWGRENPEKVIANSVVQRRKRRARLAGCTIKDIIILDELYERDNKICGICKTDCAREHASVDHIIPISKQGDHSWDNVQLAHRRCNSSKGAKC